MEAKRERLSGCPVLGPNCPRSGTNGRAGGNYLVDRLWFQFYVCAVERGGRLLIGSPSEWIRTHKTPLAPAILASEAK